MSTLKVSVSGIRGIVGESLTPEVIIDYVKAYSCFINKYGNTIAIARDTRITGNMVVSLSTGILNSMGLNVIDFGILPTPVLIYAVRKFNLAGGIVVSASHNPSEWNALKLIKSGGLFLNENDVNKVQEYRNISTTKYKSFNAIGKIIDSPLYSNFPEFYVNDLIKHFDIDLIKSCNFRIGYDPVNATGSFITPILMKKLNIKLFSVNENISLGFMRGAEPVAENLFDLQKLVKEKSLDIGFALDPDGDRLALVDDTGCAIGEEYTLSLAAYNALKHKKLDTDIVVNLSSSMMTKDITRKFAKKLYEAKVGEINVTEKMIETGCKIGGEGNGGVIYPVFNSARDSFVAMMFILELIAKENKKLSEIKNYFPEYVITKDKVSGVNFNSSKFFEKLNFLFPDCSINEEDGLKIIGDKFWVHVRASNTEPIIRIIAESPDKLMNEELIRKIRQEIL